MPINLQNEQNISTGWGAMPKLDAPSIGPLVAAILGNRLGQQKLTQENIADTIKNIQQQRESAAYTDALQKAGLLPEGDYGGLGIKGGTSLAAMIQRKQALEAMETHRRAMEARIGGRGRGGGSGGGSEDTQVEAPEDYYGLSVAPGAPSKQTTRVINGIVHVQDTHGRWKPGPKWMQQGAGQDGAAKPTDIAKAVKEQMSVQDQFDLLEKDRKKQEAEDITAGRANVPFKQSDLYNLERNRLEQLKKIPGMPSTAPQGTVQPAPAETGDPLPTSRVIPSDKGGGHADNYGVRPSAAILARAQQALDDPEATEEEKAQARKILGQ